MAVTVVNQWAGTTAQSVTFGQTNPALQSTVIALTAGNSVGGGSGTPSAGNWLVCIAGWNQKTPIPAATVAFSDDIHSFWRPGNESTSTWTVSTAAGNTRTSIWYTANLVSAPANIYAAPNGVMAGVAVLVVELAGMGPWDTVTGVANNYAAAATTMNLALGAPSASSFTIAAVCGDSSTAVQVFAPATWTTLHTTTAANGTDHTCDAVLTAAYLPANSGSLSVNGTSTNPTDLSGAIISFQITAPSPVPAGNNPGWPFVKFEAGFGSGFQTPPDQVTWTDLSNRLWTWDETTGVQYQLGQIQSTDLTLELDNFDNALASDNPGSPYYSNALNSNMSFQSGQSPWTGNNNAALAQSSTFAFASSTGAVATFSLRLTPDGVTGTPGANSEQVAISATGTYSASAWVYIAAGYATGANLAINWYNSSHTYISTTTPAALSIPAATWTQIKNLAPAVPGTAAFAQIVPQLSGTPAASVVMYIAEAALVTGSSVANTGLVTTGVPVRLRAAVGTLQGVTTNRWYIIQRNAEQWPQQIDSAYRRFVSLTATDIWSVMAAAETTPYRGEVIQDAPYAWWAMDDQLLPGGVQPTTLRNIAPGNTNVLNITQSAAAATQQFYSSGQGQIQTTVSPSSAIYSVAAQQGWMYGDPQSAPSATETTSVVTANPGSAAWQATQQAGIIGSAGWFLNVNDANFPVLANGVTVECWFNYLFDGSAAAVLVSNVATSTILEQPDCPLTILELATASAPVAVLQLDMSGHLNLITYNGSTGTSNSIYAGSDLRSGSWHHVALTTTTTAWTVYVDGGATATVSGSATGMTSAWTWLVANGDLGSGGGSSIGSAAALVQSATATSSTSPVTVNLANATTAGNCLVVTVTTSSGSNAPVTAITLGGAAGNFAVAKTSYSTTVVGCEIWTDPNCAGGQSAVVITAAGLTSCTVTVMEFTGIPTSTPVDKTAGSTGSSTSFTSTATAALAQSAEIAVGVTAIPAGSTTLTGPGTWGNFPQQNLTSFLTSLTSYLGVSSTAALTYAGAVSPTHVWTAAIATIKTNGGLVHSGNMAISHLAVYPSVLPAWRVIAHYWSAITAFGQLPAPANTAVQWNDNTALPPDGSASGSGTYNASQGAFASAVVAAVAGTATSGPSAWATASTQSANPETLWATWTGVAPSFNVYTARAVGAETQAAVSAGSGDSFNYGFGSAAVGGGTSQTTNPILVQTVSNTSANAATPLQVTFPAPTTAGNCLVFCVSGGTLTTVTGITLTVGGSADNFALAKAQANGTSVDCEIWTDANCAGGQISFTVTFSGSAAVTVRAMEWSGLTTSPVDKTAGGTGSSTSFSSGATAALAQSSEVVIGVTAVNNGSTTLTGPASWGDFAQQAVAGGTPVTSLTSYSRVSATTAQTYAGTVNPTQTWTAAIVTLKTVSASISSPSPPTTATATGDTVAQRIERVLGYGRVTYPGRSIDPAALLVQAATDIGGQQTGLNVINIVHSDGGLLYVDNNGYLHYDQKSYLAGQFATPAWTLGPASSPYYRQIKWNADPQRIWNLIAITPFSPENLTLAVIGPAASTTASQTQFGPQPLEFVSYLQSQTEMHNQANWLFTNFGTLHIRAENVRLDAAASPSLWNVVLGMNVGDVVSAQMWQIGGGGNTWTLRISRISRVFKFGDEGTEASVVLTLDFEPNSYWS